jgi:hypothetical protein
MLKVYRVKYYISIDGGEWRKVDDRCYPYVLRDDQEPMSQCIPTMTFAECYDYLQDNHLIGVRRDKDIFKRPHIRIMYNWSYDTWESYMKFNTIDYRWVFEECTSMTLAEIFDNFPADKCIQYLKERGITTCPIMK